MIESATLAAKDVAAHGELRQDAIDRWIFVGTAFFILVVVLAGFVPSSLTLLDRVASGEREIPLVLHLHAIFMGMWVMLLLLQASLMATHRRKLHMLLGQSAVVLMPLMVITGFVLVPESRGALYARLDTMPTAVAENLRATLLPQLTDLILAQIRAGILFPTLVGLALVFRHKKPDTHKRLMIFATAIPTGAAFFRIPLIPEILPGTPASTVIYPLTLLLPLFVWDISKRQKLDPAWLILLGLMAFTDVPMWLLWGSDWWADVGPRLIGVA